MEEPLHPKDRIYFVRAIRQIRDQLPHKIAYVEDVDLIWDDKCNVENGILGKFSWFNPDEIKLSPMGKTTPEQLVSTLAHELHHRWQFQKFGPLYFIMSIPFIRQLLLEKTAIEVEIAADTIMGNEGIRDDDPHTSGI